MFDPQAFLDMSVDGALDTKRQPCPVGEYPMLVDKVDVRQWTGKQDPTKSGLVADVTLLVEDDQVKQALGKDKVTVRHSIMLDVTDAGGLDMGKGRNIGLGRFRQALGMNQPGQPFSFSMCPGRMLKGKVTHRVEGEDIYDEVKAVSPL